MQLRDSSLPMCPRETETRAFPCDMQPVHLKSIHYYRIRIPNLQSRKSAAGKHLEILRGVHAGLSAKFLYAVYPEGFPGNRSIYQLNSIVTINLVMEGGVSYPYQKVVSLCFIFLFIRDIFRCWIEHSIRLLTVRCFSEKRQVFSVIFFRKEIR